MQLRGAHVLITGASRGIGAALAHRFAGEGARVSLVARSADAIGQLAEQLGGRAFPADLLVPEEVDGLIERVEAEAGPVDVLVNNAGLESTRWLAVEPNETIRDVVRLNLEAPMVLTRAVLPGMLQRERGSLVFLSSLAGTSGFPGMSVYSGTKAGINNFVGALRLELRDTPVRATVVAPGPVDTQMWDTLEDADQFAHVLRRLNGLHVIPKKSPEYIAKRAVSAVAAGRRHVRTPRRLSAAFWLGETPRRVTELLLARVPMSGD